MKKELAFFGVKNAIVPCYRFPRATLDYLGTCRRTLEIVNSQLGSALAWIQCVATFQKDPIEEKNQLLLKYPKHRYVGTLRESAIISEPSGIWKQLYMQTKLN